MTGKANHEWTGMDTKIFGPSRSAFNGSSLYVELDSPLSSQGVGQGEALEV